MRSSFTKSSVVLLLLAFVPAIAAPIDPNDPPQGRFTDDWAEVHMAGGKVGYAHSTMSRNGDIVKTEMVMMIRMGRAGQSVEIRTTNRTEETVTGQPKSFSTDADMSFMKTSMSGVVKDGTIEISSSQLGMKQVQKYPMPKDALLSWGLFRASLLHGFKPGTTYTLRAYAPEMRQDDAVDAITTVGDWESFDVGDKKIKGQHVDTKLVSPIGTLDSVSWVDKNGNPLKQQILAPGLGNMEIITTDEASALADFVPPEVFMATVIPANRKLAPTETRQIRYRLSSTDGKEILDGIPDTGMQKVTRNPDGSILLVVTRQSHYHIASHSIAGSGGVEHATSAEMAEYLEPNLLINTNDPQLIALAKQAAGNETDPFKLGDKLRRFVTDYVKDKNLNVGFASASEVCRTREGDCSEHGVLLAALGRLNGLPSRVVVGVAYVPAFGGQSDVFGYHMWAQFYMDNRWIDFDAALRESDCSPTRIAFATSSLKNTGLADLSLPLLNMIGAIRLDIIDVEMMPTTNH